jgi:hypothetical protein
MYLARKEQKEQSEDILANCQAVSVEVPATQAGVQDCGRTFRGSLQGRIIEVGRWNTEAFCNAEERLQRHLKDSLENLSQAHLVRQVQCHAT